MKQVLVATDFSELSRTAYPAAVSLAREYGAAITLTHVVEPLPYFCSEELGGAFKDNFITQNFALKLEAETRHASFHGQRVNPQLLEGGDPLTTLLEFGGRCLPEFLVLSTHGRTGLGHAFLGSFTERVVRGSPVPVLAYRQRSPSQPKTFVPRSILVPFDFSDNAKAVFSLLRSLVRQYSACVTFLNVLRDPHPGLEGLIGTRILPHLQRALREAPTRAAQEFSALQNRELRDVHATFETRLGRPHQEIVQYARAHDIDLILMATRGRTGLPHLLMGSVAEKVVRRAQCPVLTVRPLLRQPSEEPAYPAREALDPNIP